MEFIINNGVLEKCRRAYGEIVTHLEIPEGVTVIGADAYMGGVFSNMQHLETVSLPNGVTKINSGAFRNCNKLHTINFPGSLQSIGREAFDGCSSLRKLDLPENLLEIGPRAFDGCSSLTELIIPDSVQKIGGGGGYVCGAFSRCLNLKSVKLGKGVRSIPEYMFLGCPELTDLEVAEPLAAVGTGAFGRCKSLKAVALAKNADVKDSAFHGCEAMADENGMLIIQNVLHCYCGTDGTLNPPPTVQRIGIKACYQNKTLTSVILPEGVQQIGNTAFSGCENLQSVYLPDSLTKLDYSAFSNCTALTQVRLPKKLKTVSQAMFYGCTALKQIDPPDTVKEIESGAFAGCKNLTYIRIPAAAKTFQTEIEKSTLLVPAASFPGFPEIRKSIFWSKGTTLYTRQSAEQTDERILLNDKIGRFVFGKADTFDRKAYDGVLEANDAKLPPALQALAMLYRLKFPEELTDARRKAFEEVICKQVKKVAPYINACPEDDLMSLLEQIGAVTAKTKKNIRILAGLETEAPKEGKASAAKSKQAASAGEDGKKTPAQLKKEWTVEKMADGTLRLNSYKGSDTQVEIPAAIGVDPVTVIGQECFAGDWHCKAKIDLKLRRQKIVSVAIPEGIKRIEQRAFWSCDSLETVTLPTSLETIEGNAFHNCPKLKRLNLSENMVVAPGALKECPALANEQGFVIHSDVLHGYYGDEADLAVPDGVKVIAGRAFCKLPKLRTVILADTVKTVEYSAFYHCDQLQAVTFPVGVETVSYGALDGCYGCKIRGFSGSAVEVYASESFRRFESIGQVQKEAVSPDFELSSNQFLTWYKGHDKEVVIPAGIKGIGISMGNGYKGAFEGNKTVERVVIPEGLESIIYNAFRNCEQLTDIVIPNSVREASASAFEGTPWLENNTDELLYAGQVFLRYREPEDAVAGELREIHIREGTTVIANRAFGKTKSKLRVILPKGIKILGNSAFDGCVNLTELVIPAGLAEPGAYVFSGVPSLKRCSGGVLHKTDKLASAYKIFYTGEPDDTAWLMLYQQADVWKKCVREQMNQKPDQITPALNCITQLLRGMESPDKTLGNRAAAFALEYCKSADKQALQELLDVLKEKKLPAAKKLEQDPLLTEALNKQEEDLSALHPAEALVVQNLSNTPAFEKMLVRITEGVPYAGTQTLCAPRMLAFIVYEYVRQYDPDSVKYISAYANACTAYQHSAVADEVAAALDAQKLQDVLLQLAERYDGEYWLPYARYADDKNTVALLSRMRAWDHWGLHGATGRKNIIIARSGLLLNDTRATMIHMDQVGRLDVYAAMRKTDADTIRDTVLADFGFDANREIRYDLGGNTAVIRIDDDLNLTIFDQNAGKIVKSIPKKGADAGLYEKAKTEFSDLKKNIKKVITNRKRILFADFLSGAERNAETWKQSYLKNPVLNSVARLLVWQQGESTFTLTKDGPVNSSGAEYVITDEPVRVAHPIEMRDELALWQSYFANRGLKQPFEQIWEPAYDPAELREDRYEGYSLNVYRLANKEQHGIRVWGLKDYSEDYGFELTDCQMEQEASEWRFVHGITEDATFDLGKFTFKTYTRYVNHIVYLFDKWTITDRLLKDDVTAEPLLAAFTPAQIREFIHLTTENGCVNCSAMLLNYQSKHFQDLDPLAEFTLDL